MSVLSFGSLNIDKLYVVPRLARKGETIRAESYIVSPGGKGLNQSIALAKADCKVIHFGAVGAADGEFLVNTLKECENIDTSHILRIGPVPSGHAVITLDQNADNSIVVYGGANRLLSRDYILSCLELGKPGDIVLLQNETNYTDFIISEAYDRGFDVCFNPSPITKELLSYPIRKAEYLILNETESYALAGGKFPENELLFKLQTIFPETNIVLTLGEKGAVFARKKEEGGERIYQDSFKVNAVDTVGAGDTFTGYFLSSITKNRSIRHSLKLACAAAAVCVTKTGSAYSIPDIKEVKAFLSRQS